MKYFAHNIILYVHASMCNYNYMDLIVLFICSFVLESFSGGLSVW